MCLHTELLTLLKWKNVHLKSMKINKKNVDPLSMPYNRRMLGKMLSEMNEKKEKQPPPGGEKREKQPPRGGQGLGDSANKVTGTAESHSDSSTDSEQSGNEEEEGQKMNDQVINKVRKNGEESDSDESMMDLSF